MGDYRCKCFSGFAGKNCDKSKLLKEVFIINCFNMVLHLLTQYCCLFHIIISRLPQSIQCVERQLLSKCQGLIALGDHFRCPQHEAHRSITTPPGGCLCSTALSRVICQVISTRFLAEEQPESEALIITVPPIRCISWNKLKHACLQTSSSSVVIHFRVQLCLSFKTSLNAKHFFCK